MKCLYLQQKRCPVLNTLKQLETCVMEYQNNELYGVIEAGKVLQREFCSNSFENCLAYKNLKR